MNSLRKVEEPEDIEGLDKPVSEGWGEYPLDSVFVRTDVRTVGEIVRRINASRYIMDPDFQRDFVWPEDKQSKLIESCVMRIPLPVFYVAEAKDGRIVVVDGLQRLTTFTRFVNGELRLRGLGSEGEDSKLHPLNGKKFAELPISLRERIEDTQLTMYILDAKAPERARLDIFDRVNSGVPLSRQQMRNSLYSGPATRWLRSAADSDLFQDATGGSLDPKSMRDREAINRFCAFSLLGWKKYSGADMDGFLAAALEQMNESPTQRLDALRKRFDRSMVINHTLFGRHAFRKSLRENNPDANRSVINIALFDVCSVVLGTITDTALGTRKKEVRSAVIDLVNDDDFSFSITYSTNSTKQVQERFMSVEGALSEFRS